MVTAPSSCCGKFDQGWPRCQPAEEARQKTEIHVTKFWRNTRMSFHSKRLGRVSAMLLAATIVLLAFASLATAQDQPAPKWEIFGGYSFFYPNADVSGTIPPGLVPLTRSLESNGRGVGASITYDFNRWIGLTVDASTHWGESEATLG